MNDSIAARLRLRVRGRVVGSNIADLSEGDEAVLEQPRCDGTWEEAGTIIHAGDRFGFRAVDALTFNFFECPRTA